MIGTCYRPSYVQEAFGAFPAWHARQWLGYQSMTGRHGQGVPKPAERAKAEVLPFKASGKQRSTAGRQPDRAAVRVFGLSDGAVPAP